MKWQILDTGSATAQKNMAADYELLRALSSTSNPILHLYDWEGHSATYGHFLDPNNFLNMGAVEKHNLQLARRPTGGGLVFHMADFAYSILVPATHPAYSLNTIENYGFIHSIIAKVVQKFLETQKDPELLPVEQEAVGDHSRHFCMARPTKYDVMWEGRKVGGGAQRRTRYGYLHQGTISIAMPEEILLKDVLRGTEVYQQMCENSHFFLSGEFSLEKIGVVRSEIKQLFTKIFSKQEKSFHLHS